MNFMKNSLLKDSRSDESSSLSGAIVTSQPLSWGLWSIINFPQVWSDEIVSMCKMGYEDVAYSILSKFDFWISGDQLIEIINDAYGKQWYRKEITPFKQIWNMNLYSWHLWYWPTLAFKNIALEFLPRLLAVLSNWETVNVLWASSWDTINAAHSWVKWTNIRSIFMLPNTWPSQVQRLQAVNGIVDNPNAFTILADCAFDPLQEIVKRINSSEYKEFKDKYKITSFNSINIARILAQVVYYFRFYSQLLDMWNISNWDEVIFSVPSWNFWDALAWYYAKKMWLPIKKIIVATNENDMLDRFFKTWIYEPPKKDWKDYVEVTNAPSMDIAKSSNFERMLFDICKFDSEMIKWFYDTLKTTWKFQVDNEILKKIQELFISERSTNEERLDAIRYLSDNNHWIDPHTAAAVVPWLRSMNKLSDIESKNLSIYYSWVPVIFLETSHVAQFWEELKQKWIIVPWMNEFDDSINIMRHNSPTEWVNYLHSTWTFEDAFPKIEQAIIDILANRC